ncbi:MAG: hypothetical protein WAM68_01760 [Acidobacteriaceae bacterium]|jgi:hypothetical protein
MLDFKAVIAMDIKEKLHLIVERILHDAESQQIDFADPVNAFTVWADFRNVMKHCGSTRSLNSAQLLAAQHERLKDLYILREPTRNWAIMKFERG